MCRLKMIAMLFMKYGKKGLHLQALFFGILLLIVTFGWWHFVQLEESFYRIDDDMQLIQLKSSNSKARYNTTCFGDNLIPKLEKLIHNVHLWGNSNDTVCRLVYKKYKSLYSVEVREGSQKFGPVLATKIKDWLGNNVKLFNETQAQVVFTIHDHFNHRYTAYNAVRGKRPVMRGQKPSRVFASELANTTKSLCDFCRPLTMTAENTFGRIQGSHSISAANVFKLDKWHSLFITNKHSILDINEIEFLDLFNTSLKWFKKVHSVCDEARYPIVFWDMFPHAGASQVHVHVHGIAGIDHYPGMFGDMISMIDNYSTQKGTNYWNDVIQVHQTLGLVLYFGNAVALAPLASRREHELWLISSEPCIELYQLLYYAVRMYQDGFDRYCYSMGGALPVLDHRYRFPSKSLPALIQIGTRGDCSSTVSDISSLELYLFNNVNVDPYTTISKLRHFVDLSKDSNINEAQMVNLLDTI